MIDHKMLWRILHIAFLFGIVFFIPDYFRIIIRLIELIFNTSIPFYISQDTWTQILSAAIPSSLAYIAIKQNGKIHKTDSEIIKMQNEIDTLKGTINEYIENETIFNRMYKIRKKRNTRRRYKKIQR